MHIDTAVQINRAVANAYLYKEGIAERLAFADIGLINSVSVAQIQTAIDVVDAENRVKLSQGGKVCIRCTLAQEQVGSLKDYVATLPTA